MWVTMTGHMTSEGDLQIRGGNLIRVVEVGGDSR